MQNKKQNKKQIRGLSLSRTSVLLSLLLLTSLGSVVYIKYPGSASKKETSSSISTRKNFYPSQYSDTHITQNATVSDPKFKNIAFVDNSMLANAISSLQDNSFTVKTGGLEAGTWLWTPILQITPAYQKSIISAAVKYGIKNIYLSIDSYLDIYIMPDGEEKTKKRKDFDTIIEKFITEANRNGITVDAEAGWRNWAEDGNTYKALATINYTNKFNKTHAAKFRGFQYDVEPYLLDSYEENKATVLKNYLSLIDSSVSLLNKSDLQISVVIPEFYDGTHGDTPSFSYNGKTGYAIDHLLSILDRRAGSTIIVMSYRNFSKGSDGSIDISTDEISSANKHRTKIIVAQETGDVEPAYITFHNTNKKYFNKQKNELGAAFSLDKSYGGIAIHYINAFIELK